MAPRPAALVGLSRQASTSTRVKLSPMSRLALDINAAHNQTQQQYKEPAPTVRKSDQAVMGEAFRGDVQLPRELIDVVEEMVEESDKPLLRLNALELYSYLRKTSSLPPPTQHKSHRDRSLLPPPYTNPVSLAYLSGLMPSIYASTLHVLTVVKESFKGKWEPQRIVDYGSGTGSAAWAVEEVWGGNTSEGARIEYIGLDGEKSMVELSSRILGSIPSKILPISTTSSETPNRILAAAHQLPIPTSASSLAKLHLSSASYAKVPTLALSAFTLSEQGTKERRKELVRAMWDSGAEVMVVIDRGTPGGSRMVIEAREQLLMYGRREEERGTEGSWVVAPCPHDGACPLHHSTKAFCHFSQRVRSPTFLRHTKHSTKGESDAKFSYVVIKRGSRTSRVLEEADEEGLNSEDASTWPRIVAPPVKRSGHVMFQVCSSNEQIERHTIPKSQGRQPYYDAKKASWGDQFPWKPKNGLVKIDTTSSRAEAPKDKFGKGVSLKKEKKKGRKMGLEEEEDYGVMEYEMDFEDLKERN